MIRYILIFGTATLLCAGCSTKVVEYKSDSSGHIHYVGTFTKDEVWKQEETSDIEDEVAGKHPWGGISTWREYWMTRYADMRKYHLPDWKSTDFKNADDMIRWIEQQRIARGLPPYDVMPNTARGCVKTICRQSS